MSPTSQYMEGVAARVRKELIARILCTQKKRIFVSSSHITLLMNLCPTTTTVVQGIQPDSDAKVE